MALTIDHKKPGCPCPWHVGGRRSAVQPGAFRHSPEEQASPRPCGASWPLMSLRAPSLHVVAVHSRTTITSWVTPCSSRTTRQRATTSQAWSENSFGHYFFNSLGVAFATVISRLYWLRWLRSPSRATSSR